MTSFAPGVLPDPISKDPLAGSWLIFVDLVSEDPTAWLHEVVTPAVTTLTTPEPTSDLAESSVATGQAQAVCTVGFGGTLFDKAGATANRPAGLGTVLPVEVLPEAHDVVFYIFSTADAPVAAFLRAISTSAVETIHLERGYKRLGASEVFGQPDGLRNVVPKSSRSEVAFVQAGQPDEPSWTEGGSYMAYLKIQQDVTQWGGLDPATQASVIGRSADGTRLDLAAGVDPEAEPLIASGAATPPPSAHIRKVGPHENAQQDAVQILRRGTPYVETDAEGKLREGLHFVSYQANVDDFMTILQRWMLNANFPLINTGVDALFDTRQLAKFIKGGIYFAVPHDDRFIGAGMFDPASPQTGVLHIRLTVQDTTGNADPTASLEGAVIVVTAADGSVVGQATTSASGHARVDGLPTGVALTVTDTTAPAGAGLPNSSTATITLERCKPEIVRFECVRSGTPGGYGA